MNKWKLSIQYILLVIASLFSLFPIYWMFVSGTNAHTDIIRGKLIFGTKFSENLASLLASQDIKQAMINSAKNAIVLTVLSVFVCSIAGYGFEVYRDKYKDMMMKWILLTMMVPFAAIMTPLFQQFGNLKLVNTTVGVILPSLATPFLIMMFRQSTKSFPKDIIEAARMDGLSELGIFFRMFVPTMRATYAAAITVVFMGAWNSYLWPRIMLSSDVKSYTMPMIFSNLMQGYKPNYGMVMLAVSISVLPTAILFFFLQKSFAEGITGSVKG